MNTKRSFFERLSGSAPVTEDFDSFDEELPLATLPMRKDSIVAAPLSRQDDKDKTMRRVAIAEANPSPSEGQLPVDVNQTANEIIVRAFVAGVRPDELNISISRDMVDIEGSRMEREQVASADYFFRELFWGSFSRRVMLPQEVDVENSSATAKDGLLTITMPKLDKARQTKLRVKSG